MITVHFASGTPRYHSSGAITTLPRSAQICNLKGEGHKTMPAWRITWCGSSSMRSSYCPALLAREHRSKPASTAYQEKQAKATTSQPPFSQYCGLLLLKACRSSGLSMDLAWRRSRNEMVMQLKEGVTESRGSDSLYHHACEAIVAGSYALSAWL